MKGEYKMIQNMTQQMKSKLGIIIDVVVFSPSTQGLTQAF